MEREKYYIYIFDCRCFFFNTLATDIIVGIFATIILYINCNFLQNSIFHIARSLHSHIIPDFHQEVVS